MTVNDVLKQPCFEGARWVAGRQGADRVVRWVHVGEIPNLSEYLEGGELILSTGMCLGDPLLGPKFVGGLIEVGAAGLTVELGQYVVDIPPALARLADAHAFPILAFPHPVRFRDLSYDINSLLLNEHYQALAQLERLSSRLQQSLLRTEGVAALVEILHQTLRTPVCYRPHQPEEPSVVFGNWDVATPPPPAPVHPKPTPLGSPPSALHQSVMVFGHPVADLYVAIRNREVEETLYLALDHTVSAVAQEYLRQEALDRVARDEDAALLEPVLSSPPAPRALRRFEAAAQLSPDAGVLVTALPTPMTIPRAVLRHPEMLPGCHRIFCLPRGERTLLAFVVKPVRAIERFQEALQALVQERGLAMGAANLRQEASTLHLAANEAEDALSVALHQGKSFLRYQDLGPYRLFLALAPQDVERLLVEPELGPLLTYQARHHLPLLATLEAVLLEHGSKDRAAKRLAIGRQTLYYRLRLLDTVLGRDWRTGPRRLTLALALLAFRFLHASSPEAAGQSPTQR